MAETLIKQLMSRGEEFFNEISNRLLANEAFVEMLKKGIAAKDVIDKQIADALKRMNVATRKDIHKLETRIATLEAEVESLRAPAPRPAPRRRSKSAEPKG